MSLLSEITSDKEAYDELARCGGAPLWQHLKSMFSHEPHSTAVPFCWSYDKLRPLASYFAEHLPIEDAQRRVLMLVNPQLQDPPATLGSLFAGFQVLLPGEQAPAHRHTANAFRFITEGHGAYTTVDGERVPMNTGDFLLTAGWQWHDHYHAGDQPMVWLDGLDFPLVNMLEVGFYEQYPDGVQKPLVPEGLSTKQFIHGRLNPLWSKPSKLNSPIGNYPWTETNRALEAIADHAEGSEYDGTVLEYSNPWTGGSVLPTMSCRIQRLRPGFSGRPRQQTPGIIAHVIRGEGTTTVGDTTLKWKENDVIAIPGWQKYRHVNDSMTDDAVLFTFSNEPALRSLGFYRERLD